jgi:hypothetical protein
MAILFLRWFLLGVTNIIHPFYVSIIEINHNAKDKSIEISVRIFSDDLETALGKYNHNNIDLAKPANKPIIDKYINQYIQNKLHIFIDGQPINFVYVGYEIQKESTWCYFEETNVNRVKKVNIKSDLLYELQPQQMNIFHVKVNGIEKSYKLDNPATEANFSF